MRLVDVTAVDITAPRRLREASLRTEFDVRDVSNRHACIRVTVKAEVAGQRILEGVGHASTSHAAVCLACTHALQCLQGDPTAKPLLLVLDPKQSPLKPSPPRRGLAWHTEVATEGAMVYEKAAVDNFERMKQLLLPRSTSDHLYNAAAEAIDKSPRTSWWKALEQYTNRCQRDPLLRNFGVKDIINFPVQHLNHQVALLPVPGMPGATAIGVGARKREALGLAASVAEQLRRLASIKDGPAALPPSKPSAVGGPTAVGSPASSSMRQQPPSQLKLADAITILREYGQAHGHAVDVQPTSVAGHPFAFRCTFAGLDVTLGAATKLAALEQTILATLRDLQSLEESFAKFVADHPLSSGTPLPAAAETTPSPAPSSLHPPPSLRLVLPDELADKIRAEHDELPRDVDAVEAGADGDADTDEGRRLRVGVVHHPGLVLPSNPSAYAAAAKRMVAARQAHRDAVDRYKHTIKPTRDNLPIVSVRDAFLAAVEKSPVTILCGTTGCGKTTQIPQFLLDAAIDRGTGADCTILVTQPRRISAITIAERIADERMQVVGQDVGYSVRLDCRFGVHINVVTTAIVLQMLRSDPAMNGLKYLVIDEVHDRDAHCDTLLVLAKRLVRINPNVRLIVMSATLQSSVFAKWFDNAPVINVDGRLHPVREIMLDELQTLGAPPQFQAVPMWRKFRGYHNANVLQPTNPSLVAFAIQHAITHGYANDRASILVFLPGWKEITKCRDAAVALFGGSGRLHCVLLHSTVDRAGQMQAFARPPQGKVKVVFATNIAESGITIDDIGVVIDSGMEREMSSAMVQHDAGDDLSTGLPPRPAGRLNRLQLVYVSKASATQRLGRAGRTKDGVCYRLYSRETKSTMTEFHRPEIVRIALDSTILGLAAHKVHISSFMAELIESPPREHVDFAVRQLEAIGAIRKVPASSSSSSASTSSSSVHGVLRLTHLGRWLSKLPTEPHIAKMIIYGAVFRCLDAALCVAACSELTPFVTNKDDQKAVDEVRHNLADGVASDQLVNYTAFNQVAQGSDLPEMTARSLYLQMSSLRNISNYKRQYRDILVEGGVITRAFGEKTGTWRADRDAPLFVDGAPSTDPALRFDAPLLQAIVGSGLYPNFGWAANAREGKSVGKLKTKAHGEISIDPHSVARHCGRTMPDALYAFDGLVSLEQKAPHASRVTAVSLWSLLVLGAGLDSISYYPEAQLGSLDGWFYFECSPAVYAALVQLRKCITYRVDFLIRHPGDKNNRERLDAIGGVVASLAKVESEPVGWGSVMHVAPTKKKGGRSLERGHHHNQHRSHRNLSDAHRSHRFDFARGHALDKRRGWN